LDEDGNPILNPKVDYYFTEEEIIEMKKEREDLLLKKREITKLKGQTRSTVENDENFKRFNFVRYADDFLVGIIGPKKDADGILEGVRYFLQKELKLELSEEKTSVKNARADGTRFLNYNIRKSNNLVVRNRKVRGKIIKARNPGVSIRLEVPKDRVINFASRYGTLEPMFSKHVAPRIDDTDVEILLSFNQEFRGFAQYYFMANDVKTKLNKLQWLVEASLLKTLANKYKSTVGHMVTKYKQKEELIVKSEALGKEYKFFRLRTLKKPDWRGLDKLPHGHLFNYKRTTLEDRIAANECEYCGKQDGYFDVHHIRKMKDVSKKKTDWQRQMAAMNRKTLVLCVECHSKLHSGTLPDKRHISA